MINQYLKWQFNTGCVVTNVQSLNSDALKHCVLDSIIFALL